MEIVPALVYEGLLLSDGTVRLDRAPDIRPGPVQITLRPISKSATNDAFLLDGPWEDESISAPCDLPVAGLRRRIHPRPGRVRLPDPLLPSDEE